VLISRSEPCSRGACSEASGDVVASNRARFDGATERGTDGFDPGFDDGL